MNFLGIPQKIPTETNYLYDFLQYRDKENMDRVKEAIDTFSKLEPEKMDINKLQEHPILHEICEQVIHNFELLKGLWNLKNLKPYWNNQCYKDKYGLTALERLSIRMHSLSTEKKQWIKENMRVQSICENMYNPSGNYNVKYIRAHCNV